MTFRKRIERLEANRVNAGINGPSVVFLCNGETGEPMIALIIGGGSISREPDETREAFEARAVRGGPAAISLPDDGRAALATGEAPQWAQSELVARSLRQKHCQ